MKIICKKENDIKKVLGLVRHLLETESMDYPILEDDLVLEFSLKTRDGLSCPKNGETLYLEEKDLPDTEGNANIWEYYYFNDALTKLYNRGRYERDILKMQAENPNEIACVCIDAVGLHEINNHLGHAAGDRMLCRIAEGIRQNFAGSPAYRIGGDEFVVFCFRQSKTELQQAITQLKEFLRQDDYEISVGMEKNSGGAALIDTINRAEHMMRRDKIQFYHRNGAQRQIRSLNERLEKILLEKQDANQFLNAIAPEYKGVYMVNPVKDTCRYIYIPEYFKELLEHNGGSFSQSIRMYCSMFVCEEDQGRFHTVFEYQNVLKQLKRGERIGFTYTKKDGGRVHLQITIYDPNAMDSNEMLWIFMDMDSGKL